MKRNTLKKLFSLIMIVAMIFALSSCGEDKKASGEKEKKQTESYKPFTLETFDVNVEYDKVPETIVSLNAHTTENLFALGLGDKIIGTAYNNAEILPEYKEEFDKIPILAEQYPSMEVLLEKNPDFVYGRSSAFVEKGVASVEDFVEAGIMPYVCKPTYITGAKMEDVYEDFENLGKIFNIEDKAKEINDDMKKRIDAVNEKIKDEEPKTVFVYDFGEEDAFTAGNSLETDIIRLAGGKNVFGNKEKTWETVSWEAVVDSNPEYIIINDYGDDSLDDKIDFLKNHPALKNLDAVKNENFIAVPLPGVFAGIRNADTVEFIAENLYPDLFK